MRFVDCDIADIPVMSFQTADLVPVSPNILSSERSSGSKEGIKSKMADSI